MSLAETTLDAGNGRRWAWRVAAVGLLLALVVGVGIVLRQLLSAPDAPRRQVARITVLPDTPPPPPPPPREEKPPEPPREVVRQPQPEPKPEPDAPKPAEAPIKMEGPAGDGPSAFAAGPVTQDYQGGAPTIGGAGGGTGNVVDRAQERLYANSARQLLRDEIERHLGSGGADIVATLAVWVEADGRIRRIELQDADAGPATQDLRSALDETARGLRLPPHGGYAQPMRFRLTLRASG